MFAMASAIIFGCKKRTPTVLLAPTAKIENVEDKAITRDAKRTVFSQQHCAKLGTSLTGRSLSESHRANLSAAMKRYHARRKEQQN